jgi:hypothetical protein
MMKMNQFAAVTAPAVGDRNDSLMRPAATNAVAGGLTVRRAAPRMPGNHQDFHEEFGVAESIDERGNALHLMGKVIALFFATAVFAAYCEGRVPLSSAASVAMQEQAPAAPLLPGVGGVH